ncbi:MAG TPA: cytochrome C biogenesis protein [Flavobacteriales bacterium]|jgi:cytochrome c-type biogenesis protein CcmE|nr:cytochrome c maturation protein CcmE [Salibacteraceae bacterium]HAS36025.1 cytochrome C biogenesis protein [Flavobacteriales bacterium]
MKKLHIVGIVVIAVAIGAIISSLSDSSTYANFEEAFATPESEFHVVGTLNRDKASVYEPEVNPDLFTFYMVDREGEERQVDLLKSKPQDFERSEQIVLIGQAKGEVFRATDILLKCPSKYNDGNPEETGKES